MAYRWHKFGVYPDGALSLGDFLMGGSLALTVDERGAELVVGSHRTLILKHAGGRHERIGLRALGAVVLHGNVRLSTAVLQALATHNVPVTFLPTAKQAPPIEFSPPASRQLRLRHGQHLAYEDASRRLEIARSVVLAKLRSMAEHSRAYTPHGESHLYQAMHGAARCNAIDDLLGVEGAATARYFEKLANLYTRNGPPYFNRRSRRPPRDEPNALMSLAYTMAEGPIRQMALHAGLDVQLGFLHAMHRRRHSLALDLLEPARAELDRWVYTLLIQRRLITPDMFTCDENKGMRLTKSGRQIFYAAWFRDGCRHALPPVRTLLASILSVLRSSLAGTKAF